MDMVMVEHTRAPCVEHKHEPDLAASAMALLKCLERGLHTFKQQGLHGPLVLGCYLAKLVRDCEYVMEIWRVGNKVVLSLQFPFFAWQPTADAASTVFA